MFSISGSIYGKDELVEFLEFIGVPTAYRDPDKLTPSLELLRVLHVHMISTVPYETLSFQYGAGDPLVLSADRLFQNIVRNGRGRGSFCLSNNLLFLFILRSLGFAAYPVGVKTRSRVGGVPEGDFTPWGHILTIVTLPDGSRWMTDVCFSGDGPTQPMRLEDGFTMRNLGTQQVRLVRDFIPGQASQADQHKMWQYQYRNRPDQEWASYLAFSDAVEWTPNDFELVNFFERENLDSSSWRNVVVVKFLRRTVAGSGNSDDFGTAEIYGKRILIQASFKENLGGSTKVVEICRTESERVRGLKKWFDISLTLEEVRAIQGRQAEIAEK